MPHKNNSQQKIQIAYCTFSTCVLPKGKMQKANVVAFKQGNKLERLSSLHKIGQKDVNTVWETKFFFSQIKTWRPDIGLRNKGR